MMDEMQKTLARRRAKVNTEAESECETGPRRWTAVQRSQTARERRTTTLKGGRVAVQARQSARAQSLQNQVKEV